MVLNYGAGEDSWAFLGLKPVKEIKPVNPKGNQPWMFIGRNDAEVEAPVLWLPDTKIWLFRKDSDAGKNWWQEDKGVTENEMVGWYHQLNGHEFEQAPGDGEGQESLACCSPWGHKELDMTEWLNNRNTWEAVAERWKPQSCMRSSSEWRSTTKSKPKVWAMGLATRGV